MAMSIIRRLLNVNPALAAQAELDELKSALKSLRSELAKVKESQKKDAQERERLLRDVVSGALPNRILGRDLERLKLLVGNHNARAVRRLPADSGFSEAEFRVFSRWGEDGLIQFLLAHVPIQRRAFVEFGVGSYDEANTRFLLMNDNWEGLIQDGDESAMTAVSRSELGWRYTLQARSARINVETVNSLLTEAGMTGDLGILSIGLDGLDYWVWKAINVAQPRIVIAEYNAMFGPSVAVTTPYQADFHRTKAHSSNLFYGMSLAAAESLGQERGYRLVGVNSAANNAFFVRSDLAALFPHRTAADLWRPSRFREARNAAGDLIYPSFEQSQDMIADCAVHDISSGTQSPLRAVAGWR
jgi:hypothetical protein